MNLRNLAETVLTGRRAAARVGCQCKLDPIRLENMGVSYEDMRRVEIVVAEIELFTLQKLAELEKLETSNLVS